MTTSRRSALSRAAAALLIGLLAAYIASPALQKAVLSLFFPGAPAYVHARVSLLAMTLQHIALAGSATVLSVITGVSLGIAVTRPAGRAYLPLLMRVNALIQTFPPSAVIILAFPLLGFGWRPTVLALFVYSLFPVLGNTILGIQSVAPGVGDAARGMGMTEMQKLLLVELPQARSHLFTGIRHSLVLNIGTASIGAVIGAGGLGTIIISGLTLQNSALVFSGAISAAGLALTAEHLMRIFNKS